MMKKHGFTLAEVLITLAIIGVVATLTLPALMSNTGEQQSLTAFKKVMNTLNEIGQMNAAVEGFDYSTATGFGTTADNIASGDQTIGAMLNERVQLSSASGTAIGGNCNSAATTFVLTDGTAICLNGGNFTRGEEQHIWVDTNGPKGPNLAATCGADPTCQNRNQRKIYDQFRVTLFRGTASPGWGNENAPEEESDADRLAREGRNAENAAAMYAMGVATRH